MKGIMLVFALALSSVLLFGCIGGTPPQQNQTANRTNQSGCVCTTEYAPVCGVDGRTYGNACAAGCANISIAQGGECPSQQCEDTDTGKDTQVRGTVNAGGITYTDSCADSASVDENYCQANARSYETIACPANYECKDGACVPKPAPPPESGCTDSDGGQDFYSAGTVNSGGVQYSDVCTDLQLVKEYYCQDGNAMSVIHQCGSGERCENGQCATAERFCTDTDSGDDVYHKGTVSVGTVLSSNTLTDECIDSGTVREYYCDGTNADSRTVECPSGYECRNGACKELVCTDSDHGQERDVKGTATDYLGDHTDACASGTAVTEYYCSGSLAQSTTLSCSGGKVCSDGRCVTAPVCSDTDGGIDTGGPAGTVTSGTTAYTDYCISPMIIREYYCTPGGSVAWTDITCAGSCDTGACIY